MTRTGHLLGLTLALASACVIGTGSPGGNGNQSGNGNSASPGANVFLELSFNGSVNCYTQMVDEVTATFSGGALSAATVPCNSAGGIAIEYDDVLPGAYTVTIVGTHAGTTVFGGQGTFNVLTPTKGGTDQYYSFNLPVYSGATPTMTTTGSTATVTLDFTFGQTATTPGLTCAQAMVTSISVSVDGASPATVACNNGSADQGSLTNVAVGTHSIDFSVTGAGGTVLYHSTLTGVTVNAGNNDVTADISGATPGGLTLSWTFAGAATCAAAGVSFIQYTLVGPNQQAIAQGATACANSDGSTASISFDKTTGQSLAAGQYTFTSIAGVDDNGNQVYPSASAITGIAVPADVTTTYTAALTK